MDEKLGRKLVRGVHDLDTILLVLLVLPALLLGASAIVLAFEHEVPVGTGIKGAAARARLR